MTSFASLMDEDFWAEQRELNKQGYDIAEMIRTRDENIGSEQRARTEK